MTLWPQFANFIVAYGYPLILPLAVIEGPLVAVAAGFLSARGYLDWYWVLALLVCGDLIGDAVYYTIGRFSRTPFDRLGRRFGLSVARSHEVARRLRQDSAKMLLVGKWTHAIGAVVLIGAGMTRVRFSRFMLVNLLATVPKCAVLLAVGYFATSYLALLGHHLIAGSLLLLALGAAGIFVILRRRSGVLADGVRR